MQRKINISILIDPDAGVDTSSLMETVIHAIKSNSNGNGIRGVSISIDESPTAVHQQASKSMEELSSQFSQSGSSSVDFEISIPELPSDIVDGDTSSSEIEGDDVDVGEFDQDQEIIPQDLETPNLNRGIEHGDSNDPDVGRDSSNRDSGGADTGSGVLDLVSLEEMDVESRIREGSEDIDAIVVDEEIE